MIFYSGNDSSMVWWDNSIGANGPHPIRTYEEFFGRIIVADPTIKIRCSFKHPEHPDMEMLVLENIEHEHFYVFCIENNESMMSSIYNTIANAEDNGRNGSRFYRMMEYLTERTGYICNNNMIALIRTTKSLSGDDLFVTTGLAQKLIDFCQTTTPAGEDPS